MLAVAIRTYRSLEYTPLEGDTMDAGPIGFGNLLVAGPAGFGNTPPGNGRVGIMARQDGMTAVTVTTGSGFTSFSPGASMDARLVGFEWMGNLNLRLLHHIRVGVAGPTARRLADWVNGRSGIATRVEDMNVSMANSTTRCLVRARSTGLSMLTRFELFDHIVVTIPTDRVRKVFIVGEPIDSTVTVGTGECAVDGFLE
jgi:hypothetical protein